MALKTRGANFTNILRAAFMCTDAKRAKKTVKSLVSFCIFSIFGHIKAAHKTLMKLTRGESQNAFEGKEKSVRTEAEVYLE